MDQDCAAHGLRPWQSRGLTPARALRANPLSLQSVSEWSKPAGELDPCISLTTYLFSQQYVTHLVCALTIMRNAHLGGVFYFHCSTCANAKYTSSAVLYCKIKSNHPNTNPVSALKQQILKQPDLFHTFGSRCFSETLD